MEIKSVKPMLQQRLPTRRSKTDTAMEKLKKGYLFSINSQLVLFFPSSSLYDDINS
jgi:hypothetical protein